MSCTAASNYKFPCSPQEMLDRTPASLDDDSRIFRSEIIEAIEGLSRDGNSQESLDSNLYVDVVRGVIVGFDMSFFYLCEGFERMPYLNMFKRVKLGSITAEQWCTMAVN
jgi:hypothetical protein